MENNEHHTKLQIFLNNFRKTENYDTILTRGGGLNGVFGDVLPTLFLPGAYANSNENSYGSEKASGADFGFFNFLDKVLRPDLFPIFRKLSFFDSCP